MTNNRWSEHVSVLRCPVTGQNLRLVSAEELAMLNIAIVAGERVHADGSNIPKAIGQGALINSSGTHVYRVEGDVAWMLRDLAIVEPALVLGSSLGVEAQVVKAFYEEFGWIKDQGVYNDARAFTATNASAYTDLCNNRISVHLKGGKYLLDAASGPVPSPSYIALSAKYAKRICVDFSLQALQEANRNIGEHGLFLLGDLTNLPIADGVVDDAISLHTIYHIAEPNQDRAVDELVRATKTHGKAVIVYTWRDAPLMRAVLTVTMQIGKIRKLGARGVSRSPQAIGQDAPPLYFHPQARAWFDDLRQRHGASLHVWSMTNVQFQKAFFRNTAVGRFALKAVYWIEGFIEPISARFGQYPMFVIEKRFGR